MVMDRSWLVRDFRGLAWQHELNKKQSNVWLTHTRSWKLPYIFIKSHIPGMEDRCSFSRSRFSMISRSRSKSNCILFGCICTGITTEPGGNDNDGCCCCWCSVDACWDTTTLPDAVAATTTCAPAPAYVTDETGRWAGGGSTAANAGVMIWRPAASNMGIRLPWTYTCATWGESMFDWKSVLCLFRSLSLHPKISSKIRPRMCSRFTCGSILGTLQTVWHCHCRTDRTAGWTT